IPDLADATQERRFQLARWAHALYGGPSWWNPLEPDLLGEHLVACTYEDAPQVLTEVLEGRAAASLLRPLEIYNRLGAERPSFAKRLRSVVTATLPGLCVQAIEQASQEKDLRMLVGTRSIASVLSRLTGLVAPDPASLPAAIAGFPPRADLML